MNKQNDELMLIDFKRKKNFLSFYKLSLVQNFICCNLFDFINLLKTKKKEKQKGTLHKIPWHLVD